MASRRLLGAGSEVTVLYLAAQEEGVVEHMEDGGRTAVVLTEGGTLLRFQLMASAHYITADRSARLLF